MPNIRGFEAPNNLGLQPTETGIDAIVQGPRPPGPFFNQKADALSQEGRIAGSAIQAIGDVAVKHFDSEQISAGSLHGTQIASNLDSSWNRLVNGYTDADGTVVPPADPKDTTVRAKFMEEQVEPALDQFKRGFFTEN